MPLPEAALAPVVVALMEGRLPPDDLAVRLAADGLTRWDVFGRLAASWVGLLGAELAAEVIVPAVLRDALEAPDPDAALLNLARLQEATGGASLAHSIAADPRFSHDLLYLLGLGSLPGDALVRDPGLTDLLLEPEALAAEPDPERLRAEAIALMCRLRQPEHRRDALRRWRRDQFVRLIARDFLFHAPQRVITRGISAVADACAGAALAAAAERVAGLPCGEPEALRGFAVIAMGKWGSRELNYNSDIDIMCVHDPGVGGLGADLWTQVVRALVQDLGEQTAEGRVFRVDLRLRPEGASGPLVRSLESYATYYQQGNAWEMQALTRARCCAGDAALGRRFEALATEVSYGTRVSRLGIEAIRRNRQRLDARADADRNVKEGRGGIRDIEFTTQLLQLVRGVTDPAVRAHNTWDALDSLARVGAVTENERRTLAEAYDFLRRVEHLLQIQPVSPSQELPTQPGPLRRLARAMGYRASGPRTAADRFLEAYRSHTAAARDLCERLFFNPIPLSSPNAGQAIQELLDPLLDHAEAARHLAEVRFADPPAARRRLIFLAHGEPPMRLPQEIQALFVQLLPALLACVQRMPDPDASLRWFERFIASAGGRELFYRTLLAHPPAIELLCRLGGFSDALSQTVVGHPEFLDLVLDPRFVDATPGRAEMAAHLHDRLAPLRQPAGRLDDLRRFRRREQFRVGVRDLLGLDEVEEVTQALSDLAEVALAALLDEVRAGVPGAEDLPFAVIGLGKLGGRELHYSSDLDVLFVYDPGERGAAAAQAAETLARALMQAARERTRAGRLYELDARLRPFGANSPLAHTVAGTEAYFAQHAQPWERLAMTRARAVAGDAAVGEALESAAAAFAFGPPLTDSELAALRLIKRRVETERRDVRDTAHLDLKLEPGGIMDVEFLVQVLQAAHGQAVPAVRRHGTAAALAALAQHGLLEPAEGDLLQRSYRLFRRIETRLQLVLERSSGLLPLDPAGLPAAAKRLGWNLAEAQSRPEQLVADLRERLRAVREVYVRRVGVAD